MVKPARTRMKRVKGTRMRKTMTKQTARATPPGGRTCDRLFSVA